MSNNGRRLLRAAALLGATCLGTAFGLRAIDYPPLRLECMLATSDAIVQAQLPDQPGWQFRATLKDVIAGVLPGKELLVHEPATWRATPPVFLTKEALLFLRRHPNDERWEVVGPSGEGRVALDGQYAYFAGIAIPGAEWGTYELNRARVKTLRYPQAELTSALRDVSRCYRWERRGRLTMPVSRCAASQLKALRARSPLHGVLFGGLHTATKQGGLDCGVSDTRP